MPTQYEPAYAKGRPRWPRHTVTDVMTAKDWQNFAKVLYDYIYYSQSQVSGSSPVAEVPGEKGCHPLPNASPTPGPGKVCGGCGGKKYIYVQANQGPGSGLSVRALCHRCQGSGLEGE